MHHVQLLQVLQIWGMASSHHVTSSTVLKLAYTRLPAARWLSSSDGPHAVAATTTVCMMAGPIHEGRTTCRLVLLSGRLEVNPIPKQGQQDIWASVLGHSHLCWELSEPVLLAAAQPACPVQQLHEVLLHHSSTYQPCACSPHELLDCSACSIRLQGMPDSRRASAHWTWAGV